MKLSINIEQDALCEFFQSFDLLTSLQKEVFTLLRWHIANFPIAFPNQNGMAVKLGCSRKHVNQTISKFKKIGWVFLISRGKNQSKIVSMPEYLQMIDIPNRQYFKKLEVTSQVTSNYTLYKPKTSRAGSFSKEPTLAIPHHLSRLSNMPLEAKLKFSLVSEAIYNRALETTKYMYEKKRIPEEKTMEYALGTAIRMAQKEGAKLNWRGYYASIKQLQRI